MSAMKDRWESKQTPAQVEAACARARVLNQPAERELTIRALERHMIEREGIYFVEGRYISDAALARKMRRVAAEREADRWARSSGTFVYSG